MLRFNGTGYGEARIPGRALTSQERSLVPWHQCTPYRPEYWEPDEDPLDGVIWITFPPTDLSNDLQHVTSLFVTPVEDRVTAVLLGTHARVGAGSNFQRLELAIVRIIVEQLNWF